MWAPITAALVVVAYSLWIRRGTWRSRWEVGASVAIALEGCALLLMSPYTSPILGPMLHRIFRLWNLQHLLAHICLIVAIAAIIYHVLARIADDNQLRTLFGRQVVIPVQIGVVLMVVAFIRAREGYHPDLFSADVRTAWLATYWLVAAGLVIYLSLHSGRVLLIARRDPRAKTTVDIYLISATFVVVGAVIQVISTWTDTDLALAVWSCACLAIAIFAYGSARSWQAKAAWFTQR